MKIIIGNFFKDMTSTSIAYFYNSFIIILYFSLSSNERLNIIYPILLSIFGYIIYMLYELYKYLKFNTDIIKSVDNYNYCIYSKTYQQKNVSKIISLINDKFNNKLNTIIEQQAEYSKFLSQWIHNMKTPVSVINLIVQKLEENNKYNVTLLDEIKQENNKILNNLEQVLNMIRIQDFSKDYSPDVIDLKKIINKVINKRKTQFIYNNVFPKIENEYSSLMILSDTKWNQFLIEQIVSNAIKYSRVKLNTNQKTNKKVYFIINKKGKYTYLTIKDEGIGIPSYDINKVFEPFFTGENGRIVESSSGIGLYICNVISKRLGHELVIKSKVEFGTEVTIRYLSKI